MSLVHSPKVFFGVGSPEFTQLQLQAGFGVQLGFYM